MATSGFGVFRRGFHRNTLYLNHSRAFHSLLPRFHHNAFLSNAKAYYRRTINRSFSNGNGDGLPGAPNPRYGLRILFVWSIIGSGVVYWYDLSGDILSFAQQNISSLEKFKREKKTLLPSVYKLPKLPKREEQVSETPKTKPKYLPKPESKPKLKPTPKVTAKPTPTPRSPPPKPKPKAKPIIPKPPSKAVSKPEPKAEASFDAQSLVAATAPVLEAIEELKDETKDVSDELLAKYEKLKRQVLEMTLREDERETQAIQRERATREAEIEEQTEAERNKAEVIKLRQLLDQKTLHIEELERDLSEQSAFLEDNLNKLEDGRNAYDEMTQIFEEMRVEFQEQMIQQMEHMENERRDRLDKLATLTMDVRVLTKVMDWYNANNQFFLSLAELNNIIHKFEHKISNGTAYASELQYLLSNLPDSFVSHQLLKDLKQTNTENQTFHINSHQQLHDRFCVLEKALRETAMTPKSTNSLWGNLLAKMFSYLLMKEQMSRSGTSINDRISRAGYSMKLGDLDAAMSELNYLDEDVLYPAQDWLKAARQRLLGLNAVKMIKAELLSRSVKMVDNELE
eukprot:293606_1